MRLKITRQLRHILKAGQDSFKLVKWDSLSEKRIEKIGNIVYIISRLDLEIQKGWYYYGITERMAENCIR